VKPFYYPSENIYYKKLLQFRPLVILDDDSEKYVGHWEGLFQNRAKIHVEIGCNAGHVIVPWARNNPHINYVGIESKYKAVYKAQEKALGLNNIKILRANAKRFEYIFGSSEIDHIFIFFPDPWERRSQSKHRLLTFEQMNSFYHTLVPGGRLTFKTDHLPYFEEVCHLIENQPWGILEKTLDLYAGHSNPKKLQIPEVTVFERLFIKDTIPIKKIELIKYRE
jgi:tRNA (guanine-N7-)-methyltransferase